MLGLMGQLVFFHFCTFDILLNCFTVYANPLRLNSNIYRNISQFSLPIYGYFQEADRSGKNRPEWVYCFQMTPRSESSLHVPDLCQFRKGATLLILIYFWRFINFGASSTLRNTAAVEFFVNLSFIGAGKARSVCQSLVLSIM